MKITKALLVVLLLVACGGGGGDNDATSTCTDDAGDSTGPAELLEVSLRVDGDDLAVVWTLDDAPDAADRVLYTAQIANYDDAGNGPSYQIGATTDAAGAGTGSFVFDMGEAQNVDLDAAPGLDGDTLTARFPLDDIDVGGDAFDWSAGVSVDGADVDACPESPDSQPFPG